MGICEVENKIEEEKQRIQSLKILLNFRMSRIIIGSSNMQRFYSPEKYKNHKPYVMAKTCNIEVYKARMMALKTSEKQVKIQVIKNFLEDSVKNNLNLDGSILEDVLINKIKATITVMMNSVKEVATRLPKSKFALIMPITRPCSNWYTERFEQISSLYNAAVEDLALANVRWVECSAIEAQVFDDSKLHLTPEAGRIFVEAALTVSEMFFEEHDEKDVEVMETDQEQIRVQEHVQINVQAGSLRQGQMIEPILNERMATLEKRVKKIEEKSHADNLVFARDREDLDAIAD